MKPLHELNLICSYLKTLVVLKALAYYVRVVLDIHADLLFGNALSN